MFWLSCKKGIPVLFFIVYISKKSFVACLWFIFRCLRSYVFLVAKPLIYVAMTATLIIPMERQQGWITSKSYSFKKFSTFNGFESPSGFVSTYFSEVMILMCHVSRKFKFVFFSHLYIEVSFPIFLCVYLMCRAFCCHCPRISHLVSLNKNFEITLAAMWNLNITLN